MNLIHKCPDCGIEHEMACTPEPDRKCPECKLAECIGCGQKSSECRCICNIKWPVYKPSKPKKSSLVKKVVYLILPLTLFLPVTILVMAYSLHQIGNYPKYPVTTFDKYLKYFGLR